MVAPTALQNNKRKKRKQEGDTRNKTQQIWEKTLELPGTGTLDALIFSFHMKIGGVDIPNFQPRIKVQFLKEAFRRWKKFHFVKDHQSGEGLAGVKPT